MSHIVVYQATDGSSGFEPCETLDDAVVVAERMRNVDGVESPRIFRMEEIKFDFRPYFRIEVLESTDASGPSPISRLDERSVGDIGSTLSATAGDIGSTLSTTAGSTLFTEPSTIPSPAPEEPASASDASATPVAGTINGLDELEQSVHAFASHSTSSATSSESDPIVEAAQLSSVPDSDQPEEVVEPEPDNDPMVSVRRGLFGR